MPATDVHRGPLAALTATPEGRPVRPSGDALRSGCPWTPSGAVHLGHPALRTADGHHRDERRASWLELFFDLGFAGAVGQLAGAFQSHPGLGALARLRRFCSPPSGGCGCMFTFYADRHETEDAAHRIAILVAMLLCVALAASAPQRPRRPIRLGSSSPSAACAGCNWPLYVRAWHHLPATRPLYSCYLIFFSAGGALWLASLAVGGPRVMRSGPRRC